MPYPEGFDTRRIPDAQESKFADDAANLRAFGDLVEAVAGSFAKIPTYTDIADGAHDTITEAIDALREAIGLAVAELERLAEEE